MAANTAKKHHISSIGNIAFLMGLVGMMSVRIGWISSFIRGHGDRDEGGDINIHINASRV